MVGITTISISSMACTISRFESHWTLLGTSQTTLEQIYDTSKNIQELWECVCVQCIPISMNKIAWPFMRACHEELTVCWRVGITGPITKDFVRNLKKIEFLYIDSHLALEHTFLLSRSCEILHTSAVCAISYLIFKFEKEHVNCS